MPQHLEDDELSNFDIEDALDVENWYQPKPLHHFSKAAEPWNNFPLHKILEQNTRVVNDMVVEFIQQGIQSLRKDSTSQLVRTIASETWDFIDQGLVDGYKTLNLTESLSRDMNLSRYEHYPHQWRQNDMPYVYFDPEQSEKVVLYYPLPGFSRAKEMPVQYLAYLGFHLARLHDAVVQGSINHDTMIKAKRVAAEILLQGIQETPDGNQLTLDPFLSELMQAYKDGELHSMTIEQPSIPLVDQKDAFEPFLSALGIDSEIDSDTNEKDEGLDPYIESYTDHGLEDQGIYGCVFFCGPAAVEVYTINQSLKIRILTDEIHFDKQSLQQIAFQTVPTLFPTDGDFTFSRHPAKVHFYTTDQPNVAPEKIFLLTPEDSFLGIDDYILYNHNRILSAFISVYPDNKLPYAVLLETIYDRGIEYAFSILLPFDAIDRVSPRLTKWILEKERSNLSPDEVAYFTDALTKKIRTIARNHIPRKSGFIPKN